MSPLDERHRPGLRAVVTDGAGRPTAPHGLPRWLARVAPARARGTVAIALVADRRIRELNRRYRRIDAVTDVLSFPSESGRRLAGRAKRRSAPAARGTPEPCLGDVVIATGMARRQARAAGHSMRTELRLLALHGLLHLLGYDHERDAGRMAQVERRLRHKGGLLTGLIERTASERA